MRIRAANPDVPDKSTVTMREPIDPPRGGICCITLKNICDLDDRQIFTTHDGKNYDRLALSEWLTKSNKIPHSNMPSPQDGLALYHRDRAARTKALGELFGVVVVLLGAALVCAGAQQKMTATFVSSFNTAPVPSLEDVEAHHLSIALLGSSMAFLSGSSLWIIARELKRELSLP